MEATIDDVCSCINDVAKETERVANTMEDIRKILYIMAVNQYYGNNQFSIDPIELKQEED